MTNSGIRIKARAARINHRILDVFLDHVCLKPSHRVNAPIAEPKPYPPAAHSPLSTPWKPQVRGMSEGASETHRNASAKHSPVGDTLSIARTRAPIRSAVSCRRRRALVCPAGALACGLGKGLAGAPADGSAADEPGTTAGATRGVASGEFALAKRCPFGSLVES